MTDIWLHNTKTRKKERFEPLDPENVRMYVCGPTVYDRAHLGNARPVVVFDVLYRLLRHVAKTNGWGKVTYVRNFTDVDDKINARAAESRGEGESVMEAIGRITADTTRWFLEDMGALGALEPDRMPRATEYIPQMVAMIETLIAEGHAYAAEGHVLFSVESWREKYGALSGRSVDDMIAGARVEVAPYKKNPMDFVLWKPSSDDLPGWDGPEVDGVSVGRGRPGWHIECSAMAKDTLGDTFDIHGGGNDLMFPHHENEIAQSCCANGTEEMAKVWLHNEMLQVEGKKMSKSLGNFFTVRDLLDQGIPGEVIRFVFLSTHYRKPMDWTENKRRDAEATLKNWVGKLAVDSEILEASVEPGLLDPEIVEALADDLNTSQALTRLRAIGKFVDNSEEFRVLSNDEQLQHLKTLVASAELLGIDLLGMARRQADEGNPKDFEHFELALSFERNQARETKDFSKVDALKAALVAAGVKVQMSKDSIALEPGPDFDPAKLEALK